MQDGVELRGWMSYDITWLLIAGGLVMLLLLWYSWVWWSTRWRRPRPAPVIPPPDLATLRAHYLPLIDEIVAAHQRGECSSRQAHQQLSALLRQFASDAQDRPLTSLTLQELEDTPYSELAGAIAAYYPSEFAAVVSDDVTQAAEYAKKVITSWN